MVIDKKKHTGKAKNEVGKIKGTWKMNGKPSNLKVND